MDVLLLVSAFNGLTQRVWSGLRGSGHRVSVALAGPADEIIRTVQERQPDIIVCPFLKDRVPAEVYEHWRTVIIHPGPVGDRGPSSLDYAISDGEPVWGVTALQAVEEMDAGPIWASRTFDVPTDGGPPRKSSLYNGPVADAAMELVAEVLEKAQDPAFVPVPLEQAPREVASAQLRDTMKQKQRAFDWSEPTAEIVRRIRAADGSPGVLTTLAGVEVFVYDAYPGIMSGVVPGQIAYRRHGAVLVGTGDGSVWIGHVRRRPTEAIPAGSPQACKLPATKALRAEIIDVPRAPWTDDSYRDIDYQRVDDVGHVSFDFYNGAMSTEQCQRLAAALRYAIAQDTRVLVISGGDVFSNGIHLNVVESANDPAVEAWANIRAINDVCREIVSCTRQVIIVAYTGSAGAGGAMMGLGADLAVARDGIVLNPYYDIGLYGSELHTYTLSRRVGAETAQRLLTEKLPLDAGQARGIGMLDEVGPRDPAAFRAWLADLAKSCTDAATWQRLYDARLLRIDRAAMPIEAYETQELAEMTLDMFQDRSGFLAARKAFVHKAKSTGTPPHIAAWTV